MTGATPNAAPAAHASLTDHMLAIRQTLPVHCGLLLRVGDLTISVRTNNDALATALRRYFSEFLEPETESGAPQTPPDILITAHETDDRELPFPLPGPFLVKTPDSGKSKIKEEWLDLPDGRIVRKRITGMHFLFGDAGNVAVGACLANDNQVINFINNRYLEHMLDRGCLLGHAAGVMHHGRGISLAGFSGMGKSTLALHLMSRGTTFVSNDRVLLRVNAEEPEGLPTMLGIPKQPRINPGTALHNPDLRDIIAPQDRERFLALSTTDLWHLEHKYDAIIEECYGKGRFVLQAPMHALVILNWSRTGQPVAVNAVDPLTRRDLLPAFMKSTGLFYRPCAPDYSEPSESAYAHALARTTVLEVTGGVDFDAAADICLSFMRTGSL